MPTPPQLAQEFALIEQAQANARAHPLSTRKTLLVAVLLDNFCDEAFETLRSQPDRVFFAVDVLAFRASVKAASPALRLVLDLCALRPGGPRLETRSVEVPLSEYARLSVEDYMVSLYNRNTVQRVLVVSGNEVQLAHDVLGQAVAWWGARL